MVDVNNIFYNFDLLVLNANMRRLDLLCKLFAPIFAGILLTHTQFLFPAIPEKMAGGFIATLIIGLWNVLAFFGELGTVIIVYRLVPALSIKKPRRKSIDQRQDSDDKVSFVSKHCQKLLTPFWTLTTGWKIFWKQEINLAGFSLASIYLTVLGFSGITATYFLTQGLTSDYIGLAQGIGGLVGITGTLAYPFIRSRVGTIRTGLFGMSVQLFMLTFCVIGAFSPGKPIGTVDDSRSYYSPNCSYTLLNHSIAPSSIVLPSSSSEFMLDTSQLNQLINTSPSSFLKVSPSPSLFSPGAPAFGGISLNISMSVILILVGVVGARFGLWIFDLSLWQLLQEKVVEEERGVVSGVINAMNSNMDMLHYVLVIAAPRPKDFHYLIVISFASIFMGWFLYSLYVRRARRHFFHFSNVKQNCCYMEGTNESSEPQQFSLINMKKTLELTYEIN